jgi:acyl-coenzyme A synthetase/AMP-(fatty) acid ligase
VHTNAEDYSYMLYTSGTTGKPKGVVHVHKGALHVYVTSKWVLDLHPDDIYWCTADPGWVTGISYGILGPWMQGVTMVVHAGRFDPDVWYSILEKYKVEIRQARHQYIESIREQKQSGEIGEDEEKRHEHEIQKLHDEFVEAIEVTGKAKEEQLREV